MRSCAEAVVIGGGIVGTSICYKLASRGVKGPVLLEKEGLGAGSTGKAAGICMVFSLLVFTHRSGFGTVISQLTKEGQKWLRNFEELVGADSGFREVGVLFMAGRDLEYAMKETFAQVRELGVDSRTISLEDLKDIAPYLEPGEATFLGMEPNSGYADPPAVNAGICVGGGEAGGRDIAGECGLGRGGGGGWVTGVVTEQGRIATDTVVVAGGPWTRGLMEKLGYNLPLQTNRHEVFFLKRGPGAPAGPPVLVDLMGMTYCREESPDLTMVGDLAKDEPTDDPDGYDQGTDMDQTRSIWEKAARRMPTFADADLFRGYAGLYTNTPDNHPIIDKVDGIEGLYIAAGFNGYGFKISPAVGIAVAELVTEGEAKVVDISSLGMGRFGEVGA